MAIILSKVLKEAVEGKILSFSIKDERASL